VGDVEEDVLMRAVVGAEGEALVVVDAWRMMVLHGMRGRGLIVRCGRVVVLDVVVVFCSRRYARHDALRVWGVSGEVESNCVRELAIIVASGVVCIECMLGGDYAQLMFIWKLLNYFMPNYTMGLFALP